ncbi:MAG: FtsX-like permease family protein [Candidatus Bipolaricaulota bacterium]
MGWRLPLRSLWRNGRRTALSVAVIALGTAVSLFVLGFLENSRLQIQESTVREYGNLQIASPLLWNDEAEEYEYLIAPLDAERIASLAQADPAYRGSTRQLQFPGLLGSGRSTQVVVATAIEPENAILDFSDLAVEGRGLVATDTAAVFVGRSLARRLGLSVGDAVTLTLTTLEGAYNASPFQIVGIYRYSSEQVEEQVIFVPLAFGQRLLNTDSVDRVIVTLDDLRSTPGANVRLAAALDAAGLSLEPRTWDDLSPFYKELSSYFDALFGFLTLAISVLVFFIILQVLTLAFLERTREIGTLRALGTTQGEVFRLFFAEASWLAVLGSGAGVIGGLLLALGFSAAGIEWLPPGTIEPVVLASTIGPATALVPFAVSVVATLLSALYPSSLASRLRVVDALRVE